MNYYQEITLLPTADIGLYFLWQKVYQQVHLALVENKILDNNSAIGVAFPQYKAENYSLGNKLRLFAEEEQILKKLNCEKWLNRLGDYTHLTQIWPVPQKLEGHACFKHIKPKSNKEKLARRRAKRKGETLQEALIHFEKFEEQRSALPYIHMHSLTNEQDFPLFIEKQVMEESKKGMYSCYGLSNEFTVPIF